MSERKKNKVLFYSLMQDLLIFFRYPTSANILLVCLLAFLSGVIWRLLFYVTEFVVLGILSILLISGVIFYFKHTNFKFLFIIFILLGLALGVVRTDRVINESLHWIDREYSGRAQIVKFPEEKNDYQRIYLGINGQKHNQKGDVVSVREEVIAFAPLGIAYKYGDIVNLRCKLKTAENKYQKFNYQRFLAGKKVYQICSGAKIERLGVYENNSNSIKSNTSPAEQLSVGRIIFFRRINAISKLIEERLGKLFPMPESAYLTGLLLGGDNRLPEDVAENFRRTGTTHTVAVSGYNITILAEVFMWLSIAMGLWRKQAFWLILISIIVFVIMIGAPSSAVRAGIMGAILLYAAQSGRIGNSTRIIILTAAVMIYLSPFIIFYDAGFQLSFLATLGIVLIYGPLSEKFKIENDFIGLKSIVLVTISAQLGVLGILIYTFDGISLISLLANVIILPALPIIMLGGALTAGVSFISPTVGMLISLPTTFLLMLEIESIKLLAKIPWAMIKFENISIFWSLGYYFILGVILLLLKKRIINNKFVPR